MAVEHREILRQIWAAQLVAELVARISFVQKSIARFMSKNLNPLIYSPLAKASYDGWSLASPLGKASYAG
jgi:hypothetical protein